MQSIRDQTTFLTQGNPCKIDLTLDRIRAVASALDLLNPACPVITIGGTNGKGSTVHALNHIYRRNDYKTASFTSPYFHCPTELIRLNDQPISTNDCLQILTLIDEAKQSHHLTEYEYLFLVALYYFREQQPDVLLLEVGLGGRDDITNIMDANCTAITSVSLDHCEWLGNDRESIGAVKAGIFRKNTPVVLGESQPPKSVLAAAEQLNAPVKQLGIDFELPDLQNAYPENLATAICIADTMKDQLPVAIEPRDALSDLPPLKGRYQIKTDPCQQCWDVAHNPAASTRLAAYLQSRYTDQSIHAVFSAFADKDIQGVVHPLLGLIDQWHIAELQHDRAASIETLKHALADQPITINDSIQSAYRHALTKQPDLLLVFGSFAVLAELDKK